MTRRLEAPLSEWAADDVLALIQERVDEGQRLEYKRELVLNSKSQRREAAKDASGLANTQGGLLIYGVEEEELEDGRRVPTAPRPLTDGGVQAQLEDVLDSAISPSLNVDSRLLEADGGYFLAVRVFQRTGVPHMVDAYDTHRHYVRVGLKTRPMEQHELEQAYLAVSGNADRAQAKLAELPLVPRLSGVAINDPVMLLTPGVWASVVTLPLDAPDPLLQMRTPDQGDFPDDGGYDRWGRERVVSTGLAWDALGYVRESETEDMTRCVRLYRNGVFEWGRKCTTSTGVVGSAVVIEGVHDALGYFAGAYAKAGYYGRVRAWVSLDDTADSTLAVDPNYATFDCGPIEHARLEWKTDTNVERLRHDLDAITHEAMDYMWVSYGYRGCLYMDDAGTYLRRST